MHFTLKAVAASLLLAACASTPPEPQWRSLFNGRNLDGWVVKIAKHPLGENHNNTFRVENGLLVVSYDQYENLDAQFGHLFFHEPFSHYRLRLDYRFVGEQIAGGAAWALRNNGVMVHSQPPETMGRDQSFPTSVEVQFLGGDGEHARTTGNVCTPGVSIMLNGVRSEEHCFVSNSETYHGEQWVHAEIEVRGGEVIRHFINGQQVMEYFDPQLDADSSWSPTRHLTGGYIALQAESHPTEFRNIEILVLEE